MLPPLSLVNWKDAFRRRAKAARAEAARKQPHANAFAANHFVSRLQPKAGSAVAIYHPQGDELDTLPLAEELAQTGIAVLLPVVTGKNEPLVFRLFEKDAPLVEDAYGILVPGLDAPEMRPDVVLCPLLAVRPDGARLGMGGGYYDRTLEKLRSEGPVIAIGYGYSGQVMERFPVGPTDQFLDGFVSEQGFTLFDKRA